MDWHPSFWQAFEKKKNSNNHGRRRSRLISALANQNYEKQRSFGISLLHKLNLNNRNKTSKVKNTKKQLQLLKKLHLSQKKSWLGWSKI